MTTLGAVAAGSPAAALGKERGKHVCADRRSKNNRLSLHDAVIDCQSRICKMTDVEDCRPCDSDGNHQHPRRGEYRATTGGQPQQHGKQQRSGRDRFPKLLGSESTTPVIAASVNRPATPSICSLGGAGSRMAAENPITTGATVTTPTATPVHQCSQVLRISDSGPRNNRDATAPPKDDGAVPAMVAPRKPKTLRN